MRCLASHQQYFKSSLSLQRILWYAAICNLLIMPLFIISLSLALSLSRSLARSLTFPPTPPHPIPADSSSVRAYLPISSPILLHTIPSLSLHLQFSRPAFTLCHSDLFHTPVFAIFFHSHTFFSLSDGVAKYGIGRWADILADEAYRTMVRAQLSSNFCSPFVTDVDYEHCTVDCVSATLVCMTSLCCIASATLSLR